MHNTATKNNANPDNLYQCHHIFPDDTRCGSPRMRDEQFCYFHHDSRAGSLPAPSSASPAAAPSLSSHPPAPTPSWSRSAKS